MTGGLTHEEIIIACRNIGINLECGGCAENFYTGYNDPEHHNESCTRKARAIQMLYTIVTEQDRLSFIEAINHNLAQGWKLRGGPFITTFACGHGNIHAFAPDMPSDLSRDLTIYLEYNQDMTYEE